MVAPAMQDLIHHLSSGRHLTPRHVADATTFLTDPAPTPERKAAFLKALAKKGESPEEIAGFVTEFLKLAVDPGINSATLPGPMLDVVGTGGDKLNLFNISTTAVFILAGGGVCMVKHGNRGITSKSGGADVLEAMGVKIEMAPEKLERCAREVGVAFVFAPLYHPAFAAVKEARALLAKEGQRSIFNILGPLLNPARPEHQLVGVFDPKLTSGFGEILRMLGRKSAWVVHGMANEGQGMDELSTMGKNEVVQVSGDKLTALTLDPAELGYDKPSLADLAGGDATVNADILEGILAGRIKGPKRDIAVFNAAAGFVITGLAPDIGEGRRMAEDVLDRGAAHARLRALQDFC